MIRYTLAAVAAAICLGAMATLPAVAETAPDTAGGRYMFEKQAGTETSGYIRLDTQTGEVALCSQRTIGWACETAPDDRAVLESEIARLHAENGALKKELLSRGLPLPPGANPEQPAESGQIVVPLPSNADIDHVVAMVGQVWHRFVDAIAQAQKQVFNKS
jgi:hypothetical protein